MFRKISCLTVISLMSFGATAKDVTDADFDPSLLVSGVETIGLLPATKMLIRSERQVGAAGAEYRNSRAAFRDLKSAANEQRYGEAANKYEPANIRRYASSFATGALAMDAFERGRQVWRNEKSSDDYGLNFDHGANVLAGGLAGVSATQYISANRPGGSGNRLVGAGALAGAAYFASKGDRKSTELAVGHTAAFITVEQAANMLRNGAAAKGRFFTPRMGLIAGLVATGTLYTDVALAEKRATGEKDASTLKAISGSFLKPSSTGLTDLIDLKAAAGKTNSAQ